MTKTVFRHLYHGRIVETDLIECNWKEWQDAEESRSGEWAIAIEHSSKRRASDRRIVRALRLPAFPFDRYSTERFRMMLDLSNE